MENKEQNIENEKAAEERRRVGRVSSKKYYDEHKIECRLYAKRYSKIHKEENIIKRKKHVEAHREEYRIRSSRYWNTHKEEQQERFKVWVKNNKEKRLISQRKSNRKNLLTVKGKLNGSISSGMRRSLNGNKHGLHWEILVGYTMEDLRKHLESQFKDGMSWDNMGEWHIDHIWPLSRLHIDGVDDPTFKFAWSLGNLQPLWAKDNIIKYNKVDIAV